MIPDEPEDEPTPPPPADSGAALRDAIEADEARDLEEGEGKDRFR